MNNKTFIQGCRVLSLNHHVTSHQMRSPSRLDPELLALMLEDREFINHCRKGDHHEHAIEP